MKTTPHVRLCLISAATLPALGIAQQVHAVHLNAQGLGQVLIYPYYTVRAAGGATYNTALSIVNTSAQTKAIKVRFLEGRRGVQVMDFNLYLSPKDVWAGALAATVNGTRLLTGDNSCVTPNDLFTAAGKNEFRNQLYLNDSGPIDLDRTREGHIEVIEMGVVTNSAVIGYIKQNGTSFPANCAALASVDNTNPGTASFPAGLAPPSGGLAGRAIIISSANGASYGYDATALDAWSATVQYGAVGSEAPLLGAANPPVSEVLTEKGVVRAIWSSGRDAVSATLIRNEAINEFAIDEGTQSLTDWVVTFPTKREYVGVGTGLAQAPFNQNFNMPTATTGGACDNVRVLPYTREGPYPLTPPIILPGTLPAIVDSTTPLCWSTTVFGFTKDNVSLLGSINLGPFIRRDRLTTTAGPATSSSAEQGPNGWLKLKLAGQSQGLTPVSAALNNVDISRTGGRHQGLPMIALAFTNFRNAGVNSQYGIVHQAKYTTFVVNSTP